MPKKKVAKKKVAKKKVAKKKDPWALTRYEKGYLYDLVRNKAVAEDNQFDAFVQKVLRKLDH